MNHDEDDPEVIVKVSLDGKDAAPAEEEDATVKDAHLNAGSAAGSNPGQDAAPTEEDANLNAVSDNDANVDTGSATGFNPGQAAAPPRSSMPVPEAASLPGAALPADPGTDDKSPSFPSQLQEHLDEWPLG